MLTLKNLPLHAIAKVIKDNWKNVNYAAKPYLDAMTQLENITQNYYCDSGESVVLYFLANAQGWRGEVAKEIKKELKRRAGIK